VAGSGPAERTTTETSTSAARLHLSLVGGTREHAGFVGAMLTACHGLGAPKRRVIRYGDRVGMVSWWGRIVARFAGGKRRIGWMLRWIGCEAVEHDLGASIGGLSTAL
jgi:hypothetical protein